MVVEIEGTTLHLAHPDELVAYRDADDVSASPDGVRLVYLVNFAP